MISTKIGTQSFSKSEQRHDFKDDSNMHYSAAVPEPPKSEKGTGHKPGDKNVGDILNNIANPGGDPNKTKRKARNTLDKDDFLKLMLTQMKNQDPMNPMQSHEMAAQLAQFTSLEQLYNVNKNLENLTRAQDPMQKYEALNLLGKTIKADSRQILRQTGDQATDLRFNLMADATTIKMTIADENGQPVKTMEFGNLKQGANKVVWAGTDNDNREVKPGKYMFNVEAENGGKKIGVVTETKGTITGVNYTPEGPMLMVGEQRVRLQDVQKIEDDGLKERQLASEMPAPVAKEQTSQGPSGEGRANSELESLVKSALSQVPSEIKVKPETKDEPKPQGVTMPIEAAMAQAGKTAIPQIQRPNFRKP